MYIEHYAGSISMGMEFRPYYLAREWMKYGHNVKIISADYSHLREKNPICKSDFSIDIIDGVQFQWVHTCTYTRNGFKRALSMLQFCVKIWLHASVLVMSFCPDVVISSSTYPLDTWPAQRIAHMTRARYIHEVHDIWPLTLIELGGMSKWHPFIMLLQRAENSAYHHASRVVSLFPNALQHMLERGLGDAEKYVYIPNGIVLDDWELEDIIYPNALRAALSKANMQQKYIVCYLGGHALSNALDTFIDAANLMKQEPVEFFLIGKGIEKDRLMMRAQKMSNVHFFDPIPKTQVPAVLRLVDFLYVGANLCSMYRYGVSLNKVYDYMMAEKPILYGVQATNNEVDEAACGLSIPPGSAHGIADGVRRLMNMSKSERAILGLNGRRWVIKNRSYSKLAVDFVKAMQ